MSKQNFRSPVEHPGLTYLNSLDIWKGVGGFGLDNIRQVMSRLGDPQDRVKSFHVTGTNGKGSVSSVLAAILGADGRRAGLNISPHLQSVTERIVIDGKPISYLELGEAALKVKAASERETTKLSFHEAITATAFQAFLEAGVEWSVIEVGLGGRLDSSNIISNPVASIITSIDLDHQHILGDTREEIAREKAGIIKPGAPVVVGRLDNESLGVITEIAAEKRSPLILFGRDYNYTSIHDAGLEEGEDSFSMQISGEEILPVTKRIKGKHQFDNFAVAIAAARAGGISRESCQKGASVAFWPGRLEVFNWKNRTVLVDCAHNPHGVQALVDNLNNWQVKEVDIAFGVLDTKNWKPMVDLLKPLAKSWSLILPDSERALNLDLVATHLSGTEVRNYGRNLEKFIQDHDGRERPLLVTGSIYLIGELRAMLGAPEQDIWTRY